MSFNPAWRDGYPVACSRCGFHEKQLVRLFLAVAGGFVSPGQPRSFQ
jgi:hypothetical protein